MCLVFAVILLALSINFYFNGFMIQAIFTALFALAAIVFMIRSITDCKSGCNLRNKEEIDDN